MKACTWWVVQALAASGLPLCSCPDSGHSHAHAAAGWKDKAVTSKHCFWMKPSHPCLSTPSPLPLMVQAKEFAVAYAQVECEGIKALTRISLSWEAPSTRSLPAETKLVNLNFSKAKQSRWGVLAQLGTNFSWEMAKKKIALLPIRIEDGLEIWLGLTWLSGSYRVSRQKGSSPWLEAAAQENKELQT